MIPPRKRHCRKRPKSLVPERVDAGAPSAARTSARELPSRAPPIPRSTWTSASAAAGAPRGATSGGQCERGQPVSPDHPCLPGLVLKAKLPRDPAAELGSAHVGGTRHRARRGLAGVAAADARGDRVAGAATARRHRRLVPRRRPGARAHPPRRLLVRLRRRPRGVRAGARPAVRARARGRHRGRGGDGQPRADRAHRGLAGRRRPARPAVRAPRRRAGRAAVGLVQHVLLPLVPGPHARRAHPRRARDRPLAAPARVQRRGPARHRGAGRPGGVRARARRSCSTTRRRSAAPRGRSARRSTPATSSPRRSSRPAS